jgi:REP element-mobilizing transposase RayT
MENRYNRHNRRKYRLKVHIVLVTKYRKQLIIYGRNIAIIFQNSIGKRKSFGLMATLLAV